MSRAPAQRLLHVAVGLMLQNEWVILKLLYASEGWQGPVGFVVHEEFLRFRKLLHMLLRAVGYRLGNVDGVEIVRHSRRASTVRDYRSVDGGDHCQVLDSRRQTFYLNLPRTEPGEPI